MKTKTLFFFKSALLLLSTLLVNVTYAQTVVIATGTQGSPAAYNAGPIYRSAAASAYDASRYSYLYTAAELAAVGITSGAIINQLGWTKNNNATSTGGAIFRIYMKNSTGSNYTLASQTWAILNAGTTMVYENLSQTVPATTFPDYIPFVLTTPFTYTGGDIEIQAEFDANQISGNPSTGTYDWMWSTVVDKIYGTGNTTLAPITSLSSTTNSISAIDDRRPFLQITYTPGAPCSNPPVAGTSVATPTTTFCPNSIISLGLTGNVQGSGLTYEWERSTDNITYTSASSVQISSAATVTANTNSWFRCKLVCSGGTPTYSTPVQVLVTGSALNGIYTVNSGAPASATNFTNFTDLATALNCGISGSVTVNVAAGSGPYNEVFALNQIPGASATSKVKINGNGATLQFSSNATYEGILMMNGTKYVTIDSLNFKSLGTTFGYGAILFNNCEADTITRCTFDLESVTSTTAANSSGIRISNTASGTSTTLSGAINSYIGNCTIKGNPGANNGIYYGIYAYGPNTNTVYQNNTISNAYLYSAYIYYGENNLIFGNKITRQTKQSAGYCYGLVVGNAAGSSKILNNRIEYLGGNTSNTYCYPININASAGTAAMPILVANNVVTNMNAVPLNGGIYINGGANVNVYHNTINIDLISTYSTTTVQAGIQNATATANIKNNIVNYTGGGPNAKYGLYYGTAPASSDNNNVYINSTATGTQNYGYSGGAARATLALFQTASSLETNGTSIDPQFTNVATGNLTPLNTLLTSSGTNLLSDVALDILGTARKPIPTPGAYELPIVAGANAGIVNLIAPIGMYCPGNRNVRISIGNYGSTTLTGFQIHWQLNGVTQTPYTYTGTLGTIGGSGQSVDTVTIGVANITSANTTIKAWTVVTNDINHANDTISTSVSPTIFAISSFTDTVCSGNPLTMNLAPGSGYATGMIQWHSSPNGTTFTPIPSSDQPTWTTTGLTSNTWFRASINDGTNSCLTNTKAIVVTNPTISSTVPGTRCGTGTVQLSATANTGSNVIWYDAATGGTPVGTGNTFTTPSISATTTYYAAATTGGGLGNVGPLTPASVGTNSASAAAITTYHMAFDVLQPTTLISIDVFPTAAVGTVSAIQIQDAASNIIATVPYTTTVTGGTTAQTITLNVSLLPGTGYKMGQTPAINLIRNTAGASYPYNSSAINIMSNNFGAGYYYYFYNWQYSSGCESTRVPVVATVSPGSLSVNLGNDTSVCQNANFTLNAGNTPGATYLWNTNATTSTIQVSTSGTYHVTVTEGLCTASDTIVVSVLPAPALNLGNDTTNCTTGGPITLTAGTSTTNTYLWSTGATTPSISATTSGTYYVTVTNAAGCVSTDTIIAVMGIPPTVGGITVTGTSPNFSFSANNPSNVTTYSWDFGDGGTANTATTSHQYTPGTIDQTYMVTLVVSNDCGSDTVETSVIVRSTNINDLGLSIDDLKLYPNPSSHTVTLENESRYKIKQAIITNVLGQQIAIIPISGNKKSIDVSQLQSGLYHIKIEFEEGFVTRKLEVLK